MFCDRERGEEPESDAFLDLARDLGLPDRHAVERRELARLAGAATAGQPPANKAAVREAWREAFHDDVAELLDSYGVELLVLAGYMLVTSPDMCTPLPHPQPASGPAGRARAPGRQVIWQLLADEARETGAMVHLATAELDRGPVVAYCSFPIVGLRSTASGMPFAGSATRSASTASRPPRAKRQPLFAEIRRQGERREIPLLYQTVREFALEHLLVRDGEVVGVDARNAARAHRRSRRRARRAGRSRRPAERRRGEPR